MRDVKLLRLDIWYTVASLTYSVLRSRRHFDRCIEEVDPFAHTCVAVGQGADGAIVTEAYLQHANRPNARRKTTMWLLLTAGQPSERETFKV